MVQHIGQRFNAVVQLVDLPAELREQGRTAFQLTAGLLQAEARA